MKKMPQGPQKDRADFSFLHWIAIPLLSFSLLIPACGKNKSGFSQNGSEGGVEEVDYDDPEALLVPGVPTDPTPQTTVSALGISAPYDETGEVVVRSIEAFLEDGTPYTGKVYISIEKEVIATVSAEAGTFEVILSPTEERHLEIGTLLCIATDESGEDCNEELRIPEIGMLGLYPTSGKVGDTVLIEGNLFSPDVERNRVYFNGTQATVQNVIFDENHQPANTWLVVEIPEGAESGPVQVVVESDDHRVKYSHSIPFRIVESSEATVTGGVVAFLDFDGNGIDELAVGDWNEDDETGRVILYRDGDLSKEFCRIRGGKPHQRFGAYLTSARLDATSHRESLIVGSRGEEKGNGAIYIFYDSEKLEEREATSQEADLILREPTRFTMVDKLPVPSFESPQKMIPDSRSAEGALDINEFGWPVGVLKGNPANLIIGCPNCSGDRYGDDTGKAFIIAAEDLVVEKQEIDLSEVTPLTIEGPAPHALFGQSVAGIGDVNSDGYNDFVVGAPGEGKAYLFLGSEALLQQNEITADNANIVLHSPEKGDHFGSIIVPATDINQDGADDFLIGARGSGKVYIFFGDITLTNSAQLAGSAYKADAIVRGLSKRSTSLSSIAFGNINGDIYPDLLIGNARDSSEVTIFIINTGHFCSATDCRFELSQPDVVLKGEEGSFFGLSIAADGDVDGDRYDDFAVVAPGIEKVFLYQ